MTRTSALILIVLITAAGCSEQKLAVSPPSVTPITPVTGQAESSASAARVSGLTDFSVLVQKQGPAVVNVVTTRAARVLAGPSAGDPNDRSMNSFAGSCPMPLKVADLNLADRGLGSVFVISQDGYILTNAHVIADSDEVMVRLANDKREFSRCST